MNSKIVIPVIIVIAAIVNVFYFKPFNTSNSVESRRTQVEDMYSDWQEQTFNEAGLSLNLKIPPDTTFRKEIADDGGRIRVATFYVERGPKDSPTYQLYVIYQPLEEVTEQDLEKVKTGMDTNSVKEATIDGYNGIEGIVNASDPKKHYSTVIIKDGRMFSISTWPPTTENKELTDKILTTFDF